jgi:hypothetical protein
MKIYLFLIVLSNFCNFSTAGIFDSDTKVKREFCDEKNAFIIYTYTVNTEKNKVFEKTEIFMDKKLKKTELNQLDNCVILDKKNWKCGGEKSYFIDQRNGVRTAQIDTKKQLVNGKYNIEWFHYEVNGIKENEQRICEKFTQY